MRLLRRLALLLLLIPLCATWFLLDRSSPFPSEFLEGEVRDEHGPVANALVRFKGEVGSVSSDASGHFRIASPRHTSSRLTAWKKGYFIAGEDAACFPMMLTLQRLPERDFEDYAWVNPDAHPPGRHNCANCHAEIHSEWDASGHSRSVSNRRFLNLYAGTDSHGKPEASWSLLDQHPDGGGVCTACHAPTVSFADEAYFDLRKVRGVDARGTHCDYCHKVSTIANDSIGLTHGRFGMKLLRPKEGQLFFGPLDDVDRGEDGFASIYRQSRYCASCHEGTVFGVHVYGTYSEWLASPARQEGKQCQTCHMAPTGALENIAPGKGGIPRDPLKMASHHFPGGTAEMLQKCLKVSTTVARHGPKTRVTIRIQADDVGHRVPTGFVDRNLALVVDPLDASGTPFRVEDVPLLPSLVGPDLAGRPGKLYAKVLKDFAGRSPAPFWRGQTDVTDSRLFPGQADLVVFDLPRQVMKVRVRLIYRRFWQEVEKRKDWPDSSIILVDRIFECANVTSQ